MHRRVAIQAVFTQQLLGPGWNTPSGQTCAAIGGAGMKLGEMALLTQPGRPIFQHCLVHRTVGLVTYCAVLPHRRVFPKERSAFFRMAGVTGFVYGPLDKLVWPTRPVRIMAIDI
jgi:hypothetical protein